MALLQLMALLNWWVDIMYKTYHKSWNYPEVNPYPKYADMIKFVDSQLLPLGFTKEAIGTSTDGGFTLYAYKLNLDKPVYWIDSNVHGSEWWTVYYTIEFLTDIWGDKHIDKRASKAIRDNYGVYYIPSLNPWGYENKSYTQSRGVNLCRNFDNLWDIAPVKPPKDPNCKGESPESENETKIAVAKIKEIKPAIAINCHTTLGAASGIDMYARYSIYKLLAKDILNIGRLVAGNIGLLEWNTQFGPTANGWYATQTFKEGYPIYSTIIEQQSNQNEFDFAYTMLFTIPLSLLNYRKNGKYNMNSISEIY